MKIPDAVHNQYTNCRACGNLTRNKMYCSIECFKGWEFRIFGYLISIKRRPYGDS